VLGASRAASSARRAAGGSELDPAQAVRCVSPERASRADGDAHAVVAALPGNLEGGERAGGEGYAVGRAELGEEREFRSALRRRIIGRHIRRTGMCKAVEESASGAAAVGRVVAQRRG
jgi:hypothetical protein